jgi:mTERF domain-containing protein
LLLLFSSLYLGVAILISHQNPATEIYLYSLLICSMKQVVGFLSKLGVDPKDMGGMLKRSPEVFASDVSETLETKVQFLEDLGIKDELIQRVVRMFPEMLLMSVKDSLQPRLVFGSIGERNDSNGGLPV